jgi:Xaa-Pro aminopeptidase
MTGSNEDKIQNWFTYHAPTPEQVEAMTRINEAAKELARAIDAGVPNGADKFAAFRMVREARMTANAGIVCDQ